MAEIPNVNPLRPVWPTRPDDRGRGQAERDQEEKPSKQPPEDQTSEHKPEPDDGHIIDEYV